MIWSYILNILLLFTLIGLSLSYLYTVDCTKRKNNYISFPISMYRLNTEKKMSKIKLPDPV